VYAPIKEQIASLIAAELGDTAAHRRVLQAIAKGDERAAEVAARSVLHRGAEAVAAAMTE
jgi:DNA-binding FadR family transcriptional regulator